MIAAPPATSPTLEPQPVTRIAGPKLLVFDSGIGGLSVLSEIRRSLPSAEIVYVADDAGFPYGAWAEQALIERVVDLVGRLIATHRPDLAVIACNTASTLVLPALRARYTLAFVGTVPAIKPASELTRSGLISVLATAGTVKRDYTRALIDTYASHRSVTLVGSTRLAGLAEAYLRGQPIDEAAVAEEIAPCFNQIGDRRTDVVVLGCTHYPFLIDTLTRLAPWEVTWVDPAPAIARRVLDLAAAQRLVLENGNGHTGPLPRGRAIFTADNPVPPALVAILDRYGLDV